MELFACDISEFQYPVTDAYPHKWLILRAFDGEHTDEDYNHNIAWAKKAKAAGQIYGYTVYFVYRPGFNHLQRLDGMAVPTDCHIMIDVEAWGSQITGNKSPELNSLAIALANRQGSKERVWGYANQNDFLNLWPSRPDWLSVVVASYGSEKP